MAEQGDVRQRAATALVLAALLAGCATPPAGAPPVSRADPWEHWNRKAYAFNDKLDTVVVRPMAVAYTQVVPEPVRTGVNNFYGNFTDAWSAANNLLQGKLSNSLQDVARVSTNVLLGLTVFDVATELGLDRQSEDLGQTFGRWGFGPGPYIVWPLLGPSTVRDSLALPFDFRVSPAWAFENAVVRASLTGFGLFNDRVNLLATTSMLDDMALDKYSFIRDAYLQRRRSMVFDGNEPEPAPEVLPVSVPVGPTDAAASAPAAAASGVSS